ncbi:peptidase M6 [Compostimonas suwonensis]|uniref:M6 family metalloprotease-like protein n=1 Tax=Compostimonas suwonensis TaxID=1048394 RepID=A0A2M9BZX4_9MICO|nr:peptidase M6 [Compostimonas suwonensis]PJJ63641.1 M6 family metalloprotease-like protein [Compostimonas suwonensis]
MLGTVGILVGVGILSAGNVAAAVAADADTPFEVPVIDQQNWKNQYDMTWDDWKDIPGTSWNDPDVKPSVKGLKIALVAVDFPDQDFVVTKPKGSDLFGNPTIDPIPREDVPEFYKSFYMTPNELNHGRTIHEYWMEQSLGEYGVDTMDTFGPYEMDRNLFEYGLNEWGQTSVCPEGYTCNGQLDRDVQNKWNAEEGCTNRDKCGYDVILRVYAGYDETSIWQEFGEMMFEHKEDIPEEWGPPAWLDPNNEMDNWAPTRYVEWTSWQAAAQQWGNSSIRQAESSGTITHEMGHFFFSIGDNNNNPFSDRANPATPFHRVGAAPWDMMDRGSFNGPGGHHMRYVVPANMGGWSPAGLMLRNKLKMNIVDTDQVDILSREGLAESGVVVDTVTAREVDPGENGIAGIKITLDGEGTPDRTPACDINTDPLCSGPGWNDYTVEVVDRMGFDSFTPDHGVIIAKNKSTTESNGCGYNCFDWVIDANPQDIGIVDYYKPDSKTPVMATIADHRQLNDAAFHAGTESGSQYEWVDEANRLHFYVVDTQRDEQGVLSYTLAVRSLDGSGPHTRGVALEDATEPELVAPRQAAMCTFPLENTGSAAAIDPAVHTTDVSGKVDSDVFRLSADAVGRGWTAELDNELATSKDGESISVPVYALREEENASVQATVVLTATSESDPTKKATAECVVTGALLDGPAEPTDTPTETPTDTPTDVPTDDPTDTPTDTPTDEPTDTPTDDPTGVPTDEPTDTPTDEPTTAPTSTPIGNGGDGSNGSTNAGGLASTGPETGWALLLGGGFLLAGLLTVASVALAQLRRRVHNQ